MTAKGKHGKKVGLTSKRVKGGCCDIAGDIECHYTQPEPACWRPEESYSRQSEKQQNKTAGDEMPERRGNPVLLDDPYLRISVLHVLTEKRE